jgi:hypothetical protein
VGKGSDPGKQKSPPDSGGLFHFMKHPVSVIHAWRGSTVSTKVDTYQQQQEVDTHQQQPEPVEGGVGPGSGVPAAWVPRPSPQG